MPVTIEPSLSKGLAWLSLSGTGDAYPDMENDYTATNRIFIHAGAYYLTGVATAPYNSSIATTGMNDGTQFILEGTGSSHYIVANGSSYACVPASLCPWPAGSAFWTEDEDRSGSVIGYDSGYGGGALLMADFLAMHAQTSTALTTLDTQLQGYSTWEYGRVFPSTGAITEEGNYRTCGQPLEPADQANCSYTSGSSVEHDTDVNMNWENVVWSLYYEAPFAPDNAGISCGEYIAAARAIEYYYMPISSYQQMTDDTMYPDEQASGYNIPISSTAAPAACSTTYTSLKAAVLTPGSRARAYFDPRSSTAGGVSLSSGDSITFPAIDSGLRYRTHSIALVYSLAAQRPQVVLVRINGGRSIEVVLPPTSTDARIRRLSTVDVPPINFFEGRRNSVAVQAEPGLGKIDLVSITPRIELSTLQAR